MQSAVLTKEIQSKGGRNGNGKQKNNAGLVAKEVIKQTKKNKLPNIKEAMLAVGYSQSTATTKQGEIVKRPAYIAVMENFEESLRKKQAQSLHYITEKKLKKATVRDAAYTFDILSKNYNLITGKPTSMDAGIGAFLLRISQAGNDNTSNTDVNNTLHSKDNNKDNT